MIKSKDKKGIEIKAIIYLLALLAGFLVILYFLFIRANFGGATDQQICQSSLLSRDKSVGFSGAVNCKTQYICISEGGDCKDISASETVDVKTREEVMKTLADEMASCWNMFGEGNIDFRFDKRETGTDVTCSICSIVDFDSNLQGTQPISYQEFYDYLKTTKKTESQTYLQYLYAKSALDSLPEDYMGNSLEFDRPYSILTAASKNGILTYVPFVRLFQDVQFIPPVIIENTPENYDNLGCDEFLTKA